MKFTVFLGLSAFLLFGCAVAVPHVVPSNAPAAQPQLADPGLMVVPAHDLDANERIPRCMP